MFNKNIKWILIVVIVLVVTFFLFNSVRKRVSYNVIINAIDEDDISKLEKALPFGDINYVPGNAFIDHICEVTNRKTPLQYACYKGKFDMVKLLIEKGADVNYTKVNAEYSPLMCAIIGQSEKDLDIVKYLVDKGADVNYSCNVDRPVISWLVYSKTVSENSLEILKCLVEAGADVNKKNYLKDACLWKHNEMIIYFIEQCDYSVQGGEIIQAYCKGVNDFSSEIFEFLISNGADIYETDKYGKSAVDYLTETTGKAKGDIPFLSKFD